jgi:predicted alpha/beta hydrolase family esterase
MRIVCIHGYKSSPSQHFWPKLHDALREAGHEVIAPELPSADAPLCADWVEAILCSIHRPGGDTIYIAHSLGGVALLHYFEQASDMAGTPKSSILIGVPFYVAHERFASFFHPAVDFDTVQWKSQEFSILHAKDDPVVPVEHAQRYAKALHGEMRIVETGGHFTSADDLPPILDFIQYRNAQPGDSLEDAFTSIRHLF